jgi:hypothetical protein
MVCNWHLKDTRWGENPTAFAIHSLVIDVNEYEFCMIDYTVNALDGYKRQWTSENVQKAVDYCEPILKVMGVKGKVTIKGMSFPATDAKI